MAFIKNTEARLFVVGELFRLLPGVNEIPDTKWTEAKKILVIRNLLDEGTLEEIGSKSLVSLAPNKAVNVVLETLDRDLLRDWRARDRRAKVVEAIDKQLAKLKIDPKKDKKEE